MRLSSVIPTSTRRFSALVVSLLLCVGACDPEPTPLDTCSEEPYFVTTHDEGDDMPSLCTDMACTLRQAIHTANQCSAVAPQTVVLSEGTYSLTQADAVFEELQLGLPPITGDVIIEGNGAVIERADPSDSIAWIRFFSLLRVEAGGRLELRDVTLRNGYAPKGGGAVFNQGDLVVDRATFEQNEAAHSGGAIHNEGLAEVWYSTFRQNRVTDPRDRKTDGGAAFFNGPGANALVLFTRLADNQSNAAGGAIHNRGQLTLEQSEVVRNHAYQMGGGLWAGAGATTVRTSVFTENDASDRGGALASAGTLDVFGSLFQGNFGAEAGSSGGGLYVEDGITTVSGSSFVENEAVKGGAIFVFAGGAAIVESCTLSANRAWSGGSLGEGGGIYAFGSVEVFDTTIYGNVAVAAGGIATTLSGALTISNSIVAGSLGPDAGFAEPQDCWLIGSVEETGVSAESDGTCGFSMVEPDLAIGPLADKGPSVGGGSARLPIHELAYLTSVSPAVDSGSSCLERDQLGNPRPSGEGCDLGAVEMQGGCELFPELCNPCGLAGCFPLPPLPPLPGF